MADMILARKVVAYLNDLLERDPKAVGELLNYTVYPNEELSAHPDLAFGAEFSTAQPYGPGKNVLSPLGLIVGLCGRLGTEAGAFKRMHPVKAVADDGGNVVGFDLLWDDRGVPAKAVRPGYYRHFKGKLYQVTANATDSETGEPVVVYRNFTPNACEQVWVRPARMFSEKVMLGECLVDRFTFLGEDLPPEED